MPPRELADAPPDRGRAGEPDLVDQAVVEGGGDPVEGRRPVGVHHLQHVAGHAAVPEQLARGLRRRRAADSDGFHTTALPHSSAGTMYQDGTAAGKFAAVMTAATPTGVRNVNSCLSGISLGTVCP